MKNKKSRKGVYGGKIVIFSSMVRECLTEVTFEYGPPSGDRPNLVVIKGKNIPGRGNSNYKGTKAEICLY